MDTLGSITSADLRTVLAGGRLGEKSSSKTTDVYRLVNQNSWYVALALDQESWNPVVGQQYYIQFEGFEDLSFNAYVTSVQKDMAVFQITDPIGPLIYQRSGRAKLSSTLSGLSVVSNALYEQNGQMGVWLADVPGGTFVPVEVISNDGANALIQPLVEGAIGIGQRVLIK
jgi:hypothetical protein